MIFWVSLFLELGCTSRSIFQANHNLKFFSDKKRCAAPRRLRAIQPLNQFIHLRGVLEIRDGRLDLPSQPGGSQRTFGAC